MKIERLLVILFLICGSAIQVKGMGLFKKKSFNILVSASTERYVKNFTFVIGGVKHDMGILGSGDTAGEKGYGLFPYPIPDHIKLLWGYDYGKHDTELDVFIDKKYRNKDVRVIKFELLDDFTCKVTLFQRKDLKRIKLAEFIASSK